jgi:hypothetical protein
MPRSIRIEFAGAFYHVMARGNRREAIFLDDEDRRLFVQALRMGMGVSVQILPASGVPFNHVVLDCSPAKFKT